MSAIEYIDRISIEDFRQNYLIPRVPVVIGGAVDNWRALENWNPEYLKRKWGQHHIDHRSIRGTLSEILDRAQNSSEDQPEEYLKNYNISQHLPDMMSDIQPRLAFATPNWFDSSLLPGLIRLPGVGYELFIGGSGSHIPLLHFDEFAVYNFITQIYGRKEFWLYPPSASRNLYPREDNPYLSQIVDPRNPDHSKFPKFSEIEPIKLILNPGDTIFVAPDWWHWTRMQEVSISIGTNFSDESNWSQFASEFTSYGHRQNQLKWRIFHIYLKFYGRARHVLG